MSTDRGIGGRSSALIHRHPLLARISPFLASLAEWPDPVAKRQVRWTPLAAAMAAVLMALDPGCCLGVRCEEALACLATDFKRRRRVGRTYNGLLKALERQSSVLPQLKADLRRQARSHLDRIPRCGGWILLAVDGSKEDLPRTRDLEREFGIADNGVGPQALVTAVVEVNTGLPWDWRIDKGRASERDHLLQMIPSLPADALLLADGNFVGYPLWSALQQQGKHFLIRVGGNVHLITQLWPEAASRRRGDIVYAWPRHHQARVAPLTLRLIRVESGQGAVYLLTNVLDRRRLSPRAAGHMYRQRWGVELFYRTLKRTLGYAKLHSRSGRRARIELEWGLIALSIAIQLGIHALHQNRRDPRRLSPAPLIRSLRRSLLQDAAARDFRCAGRRLTGALAASVKDDYRRRSSKRSRHHPITSDTPFPLVLKPPRLRTATAQERQLARQYAQPRAA
jgi:hypothetical protein